ncbi:MAG: ferritin [Eubacteriales bacterium]|nr:ferritin [Eubacteriales bacterium]NLO13729.1 ferritin [Clostridiales bacterium]
MIHQETAIMLVEQINKELYSGYLYMAFANFYEGRKLSGFAHWYMVQAAEEYQHAMKIRSFLIRSGHPVALGAIEKPNTSLNDCGDPLHAALKHEQYITASIETIYGKALEVKDHLTVEFLDWFIMEQAEEEASAQKLIDRFELIGCETGRGLRMLDRELSQR